MATSLSAAHRVPHTVKPPGRCPHCGSTRLIRKGTRRKKLEIVQLWQCKVCRRVFTPAPPAVKPRHFPPPLSIKEREKSFIVKDATG